MQQEQEQEQEQGQEEVVELRKEEDEERTPEEVAEDVVSVPSEKAPKFEFRKTKKTRAEKREEQLRRRKERSEAKRIARNEKSEREGVVTAEELAETEYEFRNGLRCVKPYEYEYKVYAKERWVGQKVIELFVKEFGLGREYYLSQIEKGRIRLNGKTITPDTEIGHGNLVTNLIHRHEPPITDQKPAIIAQNDELVVVDKPSSISTAAAATKYMEQLKAGLTQKTYLARAKGRFPDGETFVDQPIELLQQNSGRGMRNRVGPNGKPAQTLFKLLKYDEASDSSVILCKPKTGRTHQIRLHLAFLGHPIVNDPIYNDELYENKKVWSMDTDVLNVPLEDAPMKKDAKVGDCPWCSRDWIDPQPDDLVMWLHALSYEGPDWKYETPLPKWALIDSIN